MLVGRQKRGLLGRRETWLNVQLRLRCDLPFPRTNSTSTFLANGIKRHASLPSVGWPLPSTKDTNISALVLLRARGRVRYHYGCCLVSNIL